MRPACSTTPIATPPQDEACHLATSLATWFEDQLASRADLAKQAE